MVNLNDPYMNLIIRIVSILPDSLIGDLRVYSITREYGLNVRRCLINVNYVFRYEDIDENIQYAHLNINGDQFIRGLIHSPMLPAFLSIIRLFRIQVYTGLYEDKVLINISHLYYDNRRVLWLETKGSVKTLGPYN